MKISWGYKIAGAYVLFVAGILFLAFKANNEEFDLVTKDYYSEELKYQQVIDQSENYANLSAPLSVEKTDSTVKIIFPAEMKEKKKSVDFYLYYPADAKKDFRISFETNENEFIQPLPTGTKGMYDLKLTWQADSTKYLHKQKIFF
jgi:hypothetical protein